MDGLYDNNEIIRKGIVTYYRVAVGLFFLLRGRFGTETLSCVEIRAYNGKLNYREFVELVTRINNRVNTQRLTIPACLFIKAASTPYHRNM